MKGKASSVWTRRSVAGDLETKSGLIGDDEWLIGNGSSATDHQQRRWFISKGEWLIGDGSTLQVFFLFGFLFFNLVGEWLNVFCFAEWVNVFFFFLGVFIVLVSDELFSSLLPTSSDEFLFRHKVVFSDEIIWSLLPTSSEEFMFRHKRTQNLFHF